MAALTLTVAGLSPATANGSKPPGASVGTQVPYDARRAGVASYLRHLYAVYFRIRACAEMSVAANDRSLVSEVSLEEARRTLKLIDAASAEVGLDADATWTAVATVTAEALKANPSGNLEGLGQARLRRGTPRPPERAGLPVHAATPNRRVTPTRHADRKGT